MRQTRQAMLLKALQPALRGSQWDTTLARLPLEWHALFEHWP
jgi:hypothetical protein